MPFSVLAMGMFWVGLAYAGILPFLLLLYLCIGNYELLLKALAVLGIGIYVIPLCFLLSYTDNFIYWGELKSLFQVASFTCLFGHCCLLLLTIRGKKTKVPDYEMRRRALKKKQEKMKKDKNDAPKLSTPKIELEKAQIPEKKDDKKAEPIPEPLKSENIMIKENAKNLDYPEIPTKTKEYAKINPDDKILALKQIGNNLFAHPMYYGDHQTEHFENKCSICYNNPPNVIYKPCLHGGVCRTCAIDIH